MQYRSWLLHDGLTYYRLIRESENNMPARQSVSNYPSLPARNQILPYLLPVSPPTPPEPIHRLHLPSSLCLLCLPLYRFQ